jgi:hypothetical protein
MGTTMQYGYNDKIYIYSLSSVMNIFDNTKETRRKNGLESRPSYANHDSTT